MMWTLLFEHPAFAHGTEHQNSPHANTHAPVSTQVVADNVTPLQANAFASNFDPVVVTFLFVAFAYLLGLRSFHSKPLISRSQKASFFAGIATVLMASLPPVDTYADQFFSAHMFQHMLIAMIGVPLIVFGSPLYVCVRAVPARLRNRFVVPLLQNHTLRLLTRFLATPLLAVVSYEATFWIWHFPYFYNSALTNSWVHILEHACMALAAFNVWRLIIDAGPFHSNLKPPLRLLIIFLVMTLDMALSAALTYSEKVWYAYDQLSLPKSWPWTRLEDQQVGGLVMWVGGGSIWLVALLAVFARWYAASALADSEKPAGAKTMDMNAHA